MLNWSLLLILIGVVAVLMRATGLVDTGAGIVEFVFFALLILFGVSMSRVYRPDR